MSFYVYTSFFCIEFFYLYNEFIYPRLYNLTEDI